MRVANQATLQELAERIDQADAVVIGGGSGLSSAAGYDHYHWSPALSEALAPFREQYGFTSPLAGFYHCFSSYGEQWGYYSQYIRFMWEAPTGQPYCTCLNREASHRPEHLRGRSLYLQGDLAETLAALRQERSIAATIK